ncbi:MAG TPA: carotenoid biosynthesis protein [Desulfomonilia bacterium]|nr:carotenoid biosynthesis protein [Desulfomonilia bacterium]
MVPVSFFEIFLWCVFVAALADGFRRFGVRNGLMFFIPLVIYGWVLEESAIAVFHRYAYTHAFLLKFLDAPFCIAAGWTAILYSGIVIAEGLRLNRFRAALFVALWGLGIDFSMDALAVRFGYWIWFPPADVVLPYFNVPVSNFVGWFIILSCFTYFHLYGRDKRYRKILMGFDAMLPSLPLLLLAIYIMLETEYERAFTSLSWWHMVMLFPLPLMLVLSVWLMKLSPWISRENRVALLITEGFHVFFVVSAIFVWMSTGQWAYMVAAGVALMPVAVYTVRSVVRVPAKCEQIMSA